MKISIILFLLIPALSFGQGKYVLLDRGWFKPALFVDSVTKEHIRSGYFPMPTNELDTMVTFVKTFRKLGKQGLSRKYFNNDDYKMEVVHFEISNIKHPYGDIYDIQIVSTTPFGLYKLMLSDPQNDSKKNVILINDFYSYLKQTVKRRNKMENK